MLDPVRGGYPEYLRNKLDEPSIIMPRCFEARFGMTYLRFRQLMFCFKMAWSPSRKSPKGVAIFSQVNTEDGNVVIDGDYEELNDSFFKYGHLSTKSTNTCTD